MKKILIYILAAIGIVTVIFFLRIMFSGVSSTVNTGVQVQKAKCMAECNKTKLSDNCNQYCLQKSLGN